ncbi:MAG TPA: MFS transporter [Stellaceae bacterium]|jgi:putative MFS transporter|nr:MFS transporter [Stellaceae bacterium]
MLELLERQQGLTRNQKKIIFAAILGDMLEFFDYFLIGYVLAFIVTPWKLTYGESAIMLLSSGVGAIPGALFWGWMADRVGRRKIFAATVLTFSIATGFLALTPDRGWVYMSLFRFLVGFGVGGLYVVDLPLVQEFVPTRLRGRIGGLVTACIPIGTGLGAVAGAYLAPIMGWRGLFAIGLLPALLTLLIRAWVPESPRWLVRRGRLEEARQSLAWALELDPKTITLPPPVPEAPPARWSELFNHPRSVLVTWIGVFGEQCGGYGITLWSTTLLALLLGVPPAQAAFLMIWASVGEFIGRLTFAYLSDRIGRIPCCIADGFGAAIGLVLATVWQNAYIGGASVFWLMIIFARFFSGGGFAAIGPYAAEVWPAHLRASGMGSAYGIGSIGKIVGPAALAVIVGSSNIVSPKATVDAILPAFLFLAACHVISGIAFCFGKETRGKSIEQIDDTMASAAE